MLSPSRIKSYVSSLRNTRKWHRLLGVTLSLLLFISATTGILLALKKDVELIQPATHTGSSKDMQTWKSMAELSEIATTAFHQQHPDQADNQVDRIDVRPSKGIVKVLFEKNQWEAQVDAQSGEVLHIARRHADWIEALHDGSIISDLFKLLSMHFLGIGVIVLLSTGLWLWYGPKEFRRLKKGG
jgi:uncharacterized iron-regulated membrane protein